MHIGGGRLTVPPYCMAASERAVNHACVDELGWACLAPESTIMTSLSTEVTALSTSGLHG